MTKAVRQLYELPALIDPRVCDRKRRLFAVASLRRFERALLDPRSVRALAVAERFAEGLALERELREAEESAALAHWEMRESRFGEPGLVPWSWAGEQLTRAAALVVSHGLFYAEDAADYARRSLAETEGEVDKEEALQCVLLREIVGPWPILPRVDPIWLAANDRAAWHLLDEVQSQGAFELLPIVADALEDAGCAEEGLLSHLRGPSVHVRGCWAVDVLLGRG